MRSRLALVGDARIAASPSPAIHDAIFGAGTYRLIADSDADAAFAAAEADCRGINVTAPHKLAAARRYAAVLDDDARRVGAVNTVRFDDQGRAIRAGNTDVEGLRVAWHRASVLIEGRVVSVIGAGGAARAVVVAAADAGARRVVVHARRREAAAALIAVAASAGLDATIAELDDEGPADIAVVAASDLADPERWLKSAVRAAGVVHDLRYGRRALPVRNAALARRLLFLDGTSMLLGQALASAAIFAGAPPDEAARVRAAHALATTASQRDG